MLACIFAGNIALALLLEDQQIKADPNSGQALVDTAGLPLSKAVRS